MKSEPNNSERVVVFDTTLRDGEQSPGASMNLNQKLQVASGLKELGVDVIELGFPVASPGDFEAVQKVAQTVEGPIMCALSRATKSDIDRTWEALRDAPRRRLHLFLATSPLHRQYKLKMDKPEVLRRAVESVKYGREKFDDVEFSAEDAARTEPEFLVEVIEAVVAAGAGTVNIPDTVGYALPEQYGALIAMLKKTVRGIDKAVISVHCHNDLGLAVANTISALQHGARQVECTINGIGERAGNCALEEVVMALRTRHDSLHLHTGIKTERLYPTSRLLSNMTGLHVQRNKAIVGQNAFAHEAGIHQHGVLAHAGTYEIMRPEDVGFSSNSMVLGKHSGRHMVRQRVTELGYHLDDVQIERVFEGLKILADKKKAIYDADIEGLIQGYIEPTKSLGGWELVAHAATSSTGALPHATVTLKHADGRQMAEASVGDGPIDAVFKAIEKITGVSAVLKDYQVTAAGSGADAQGEVSIELEHRGRRYRARTVLTDIVLGSAQAYVEAINRIAADMPVSNGAAVVRGEAAPAPVAPGERSAS
jgi:2-isopropylmalate synthase